MLSSPDVDQDVVVATGDLRVVRGQSRAIDTGGKSCYCHILVVPRYADPVFDRGATQ